MAVEQQRAQTTAGSMHVAIVGGGIAGLAAAYRLRRLAPDLRITLLESSDRLGGKIVTDRVDGFVIEGGPDAFLSYKPRGLGLCRELGLEQRLQGTNTEVHRSYVMRRGQLYPAPEGLTGLVPSRLGPMVRTRLVSPLGKLRMALDLFVPPRRGEGDEPLAAFVRRRVGREVYRWMIEPTFSGIYAGDGERLSLLATFPQLRRTEIEHRSMIRGMFAAKRNAAHSARTSEVTAGPTQKLSAFLTPRTGLAEIVEALQERLENVNVLTATRVERLETSGQGYLLVRDGAPALPADALVLATPAFATAAMLDALDPQLASVLREIPYVSTATVSLAYRREDVPRPLDGYGYVVPAAEGRPVLACTWTSTKFPHRAPTGHVLIRGFLGRAGQQEILDKSDDDLLQLVRDEAREVLGVIAPPVLHRVFRWPDAMPQYTVGHLERLATIDSLLSSHPGLLVAGSAYRGVGIPDCIASGEVAAEQVALYVRDALFSAPFVGA